MARNLPVCIVNPIPGQEERNSDHLLEQGVAIRCNNLPTLAYKIETLLADPGRLSAMSAATRALARPDAAMDIVQTLLNLPHDQTIEKPRRWPFAPRNGMARRMTAARLLATRRANGKRHRG